MANEVRLIDPHDLWSDIMMLPHNGDMISSEEVEQAIMDAPTVDAVEASRLGYLGRLMMPYKGCPRGRMGARGDGRIIELDPIKDVEGDIWVPVLEEDLNFLKAKAVEVVRCKDCKHYWKNVNTPGFDGKCTTVGDDDFCSDGERKDNERKAD